MRVIKDVLKMQSMARIMRLGRSRIGLVATMGYLHEGHLSLIRESRVINDVTVVSIFVNPTQFGPNEDFRRYPRDVKRDLELVATCGADVVFIPKATQMYADDFSFSIKPGYLDSILCALTRPGHFQGVATVVAKLFNIIGPDNAYFGQKDLQQVRVIEAMVKDLNFPVKVRMMPIIRESDGLAMSSRNSYLSLDNRKRASIIYRSLCRAAREIKKGIVSPARITSTIKNLIQTEKSVKVEYIEIVEPHSLKKLSTIKGLAVILVAARLGGVRLIDNMIVSA